MRWALLPLPLLAMACAEMRTPPPAAPPADLGGNRAGALVDPLRAAILSSAAAFADSGLSLADKPAETAQAAAQLEYLAQALPRAQGYSAMPETTLRSLGMAQVETRAALGIDAGADSGQVMRALLAAARALRANQPQVAAAALPAGMFRPGGAGSLRRFAEPGPLPQAAAATTQAQLDLARIDRNQLWLQGRSQDGLGMETGTTGGGIAPGLGSAF